MIERQVDQMTRLVEDLLDAPRIRSGHLHLRCERVDLCAVLAHATQTVEFTMQQRNHKMTTSFPTAPIWLQARNLIERHGGFVTVTRPGLGHGSEFTVRLPLPME
jgi:signal transduction histidine kinase